MPSLSSAALVSVSRVTLALQPVVADPTVLRVFGFFLDLIDLLLPGKPRVRAPTANPGGGNPEGPPAAVVVAAE